MNIKSPKDNINCTPQLKVPIKTSKFRLKTTEQIKAAIHSQPLKDELNSKLFSEWIKNIIERAYPAIWNNQTEKKISEMDCYYIPDMDDETIKDLLSNDEKIYEILNWLICRPQFFWKDRTTNERIITQEWLDRINYILNMAAKHTLRHIQKFSLLHTNPSPYKKKSAGYRDPTSTTPKDEEPRIGYNYFKYKLKDFTTSQRSDKDKKEKIYFNIQSKEHFCQLIRALLVDFIPNIPDPSIGWTSIAAAVYDQDAYDYYYDENKKDYIPTSIRHKKWDMRLKPTSTREKDWLFLKEISCYADIERCDSYTWRYNLFDQIIKEFIEPRLQMNKPKNIQKDNGKKTNEKIQSNRETQQLDDGWLQRSRKFSIDYKKRTVKWEVIFCTKSQNSIQDKTMRDINYSAPTSLKDMIRWTIIVPTQEDVLFMLHYLIKYFIQNPEHNFSHNSASNDSFDPERWILRWLPLKDKWVLNTEIPEWLKNIKKLPKWEKPKYGKNPYNFTNEELDRAATNFILSSMQKPSDKKSSNSSDYIDVKITPTTLMRPNPLDIEIKIMTEENYKNNETGMTSHDIMRLNQDNEFLSRTSHFLMADRIKHEIKLLLEKRPDLKSQIEAKLIAENHWKDDIDVEEKIYNDIIDNLVIIRGKYWKDWNLEPLLFCYKEVWNRLSHAWFNFSAEWFHYDNEENK